MSNLKQHERSDSVKWFIVGVVIVLIIAAIVLGVFSNWYTNWDTSTWFGRGEPTEDQDELVEAPTEAPVESYVGAIIRPSQSDDVRFSMQKIAVADYAAYGVSPLAETAYTLTATITPSTAYVQGIIWSVEFVNPSDSWASGKTATNYVTVTPSGSNNHTATVECVSPFNSQIKIVATSEDNENISAECLVDYGKRFRTQSGQLTSKRTIGSTSITHTYKFGQTVTVNVEMGGRNPTYSNTDNASYTLGDGTLSPASVDESLTLKMAPGLKTALSDQGVTTSFAEKDVSTLSGSSVLFFDRTGILSLTGLSPDIDATKWSKFITAINNNGDGYDFAIEYKITSEYATSTTSAKIKLNTASMMVVTDVDLSSGSIVF